MRILVTVPHAASAAAIAELVAAARAADGTAELVALSIGPLAGGLASALARAGVRTCYETAHAADDEQRLHLVEQAARKLDPGMVLVAATDALALGPRLAHRLGAVYVSGCSAIEREPHSDRLLFTRPIYGGRALEVVAAERAPIVAAIRPKSFASTANAADAPLERLALELAVPVAAANVTVCASEESPGAREAQLEDARIVVSGGRGLGSAEAFDTIRRLAAALGGAVGASRAAVDMGWIAHSAQVGQTGTTVAPELYIAVGISGAVQHVSGMAGSRRIVAINSDEEAPIFNIADVGVVADYRAFLPALIDALETHRSGARADSIH